MENVDGNSLRNTKKRLPGIEALRLLSILFIVIFHVAIWNDVDAISGSAFLTVLGGIGVNAFAVITGFVYYSPDEKPLEPKKYLRLWTTVLFYSFGIMLLGKILTPGKVSTKDLAFSALPVTSSFWWYFSSYSALFFLQPMLSSMVRYMTVNRKYIYIYIYCGIQRIPNSCRPNQGSV